MENLAMRHDFVRVAHPEPHGERTRLILTQHPEIRELFGPEPRTALYGLALVGLQLALARHFGALSWPWLAALSWLVGAPLNHALWVLIHECSHRLVFPRSSSNRWLAMLLNLPHAVPSAMAFCKYHLLHHARQGDPEYDADLPGPQEAEWVGNSAWRKALMMMFYSFINGSVRPARLKKVPLLDRWVALNTALELIFVAAFWHWAGAGAVAYLLLSTFWGLGLHPLGGRWIAEHYLVHDEQETNSYYGPLNRFCFNVGFHNEHHDFVRVPWTRLPEVRRRAPEFYDSLFAYRSWSWALWRFIVRAEASPYDRVVRERS